MANLQVAGRRGLRETTAYKDAVDAGVRLADLQPSNSLVERRSRTVACPSDPEHLGKLSFGAIEALVEPKRCRQIAIEFLNREKLLGAKKS